MVQKGEIELAGGGSAFETKEVEPTEQKSPFRLPLSLSPLSISLSISLSLFFPLY
jgi:hypothetical protein